MRSRLAQRTPGALCDLRQLARGRSRGAPHFPKIGNRREDSLECHVLFSKSPNVLVVLLDDVGKDDFSRLIEPEDRLSVVMTRQ